RHARFRPPPRDHRGSRGMVARRRSSRAGHVRWDDSRDHARRIRHGRRVASRRAERASRSREGGIMAWETHTRSRTFLRDGAIYLVSVDRVVIPGIDAGGAIVWRVRVYLEDELGDLVLREVVQRRKRPKLETLERIINDRHEVDRQLDLPMTEGEGT